MNLRQLRYFVTVIEERTFTRAAERLNIAQPPLSRQIQQLEGEIGAELVDRTARPLRPTAVGQLVYEQAIQLLGRMADMRDMVARAVKSERRRFAIGFVGSTLYERLPQLIRGFRAATQNVELSLIELMTLEQIAALKEGRIDIGFGRIRFEDDGVRRVVLREEPLVAALPASHPFACRQRPISIFELAREPLILYPRQPRPSYADQVTSLFHDRGLEPHVAYEARELQIAIGLVAADEGVCVVPESVRKSQFEGVCYRELLEPAVSPIIMSYRVGNRSPELRLMAEVITSLYAIWGYDIPVGVTRLAQGSSLD